MGLGEMVKLVKIGALICSILLFSMVPARAEYLIDVGDTLEISVAGMPELRQRVVVQLDGSISYPLLGTARVGIRDSSSRRAGRRRPAQTGTGNLPWLDEVQDLAREPDVCIGAHSISHPVLAKCDRLTAMQEIAESKAHLERRLGKPVRHLAYPFGDPGAVGAREFDLARQAGYLTAVTTRPGHLFREHFSHLHELPRVSLNGLFQNEMAFRSLLSGVPFWIWNRRRVVTR